MAFFACVLFTNKSKIYRWGILCLFFRWGLPKMVDIGNFNFQVGVGTYEAVNWQLARRSTTSKVVVGRRSTSKPPPPPTTPRLLKVPPPRPPSNSLLKFATPTPPNCTKWPQLPAQPDYWKSPHCLNIIYQLLAFLSQLFGPKNGDLNGR